MSEARQWNPSHSRKFGHRELHQAPALYKLNPCTYGVRSTKYAGKTADDWSRTVSNLSNRRGWGGIKLCIAQNVWRTKYILLKSSTKEKHTRERWLS